MNVMEAYAQGLDDGALVALAETNLVDSQMRYVRAEIDRRGLEADHPDYREGWRRE